MAFKLLTRSTSDQASDPLVDKSRADSWPSTNRPNTKPQVELDISDDNHAASLPGSSEGKIENSLSPKLQEEKVLEKHEELTVVRTVKFLLRGVNFTCSVTVLAITSTTMHIFFATQHLPAENHLPAWANGTQTWPQYVVLATSCVSLALCLMIFYSNRRCGHRGAEKVAVYHTIFAAGVFIFSMAMWGIAAGILQVSRYRNGNRDIWGWSCVDSNRRELLSEKINYGLVCKLESWSFICCIIEVVIEAITIVIYSVIFYRYYSKYQLRKAMDALDRVRSDQLCKAMDARDRTRSNLYSARGATAFELLSRSYSAYMKSPRSHPAVYTAHPDANEGLDSRTRVTSQPLKPFVFQPPHSKVYVTTPRDPQASLVFQPTFQANNKMEHAPVAWSEQNYEVVPIPGAYVDPASPMSPQQIYGSLAWSGRR